MRQRVIVGTKLVDTLARGVMALVCTYRLPVVESGQFGLAVTVMALAAFALGYERRVDLMRQLAGRPNVEVRAQMANVLRFFAVHAAWVLPLVVALLMLGSDWPARWVALLALILVAEHLSNQSYHAVLIDASHFPLLALATARSILIGLGLVAAAVFAPQRLSLDGVFTAWALVSAVYLLATAALWWVRFRPAPEPTAHVAATQSMADQYRASRIHFIVGLVAVAALQVDRLIVAGTLTPFDVGIYFRNVTLAGLALQLFNIVSFNRVATSVYAHAREGQRARARVVVGREYRRFSLTLSLTGAIGLGVAWLWPGQPLVALHIEPLFVLLFGAGVLLRAAADYAGLLLLALGADNHVLRNQVVAVAFGALILALGTWRFGLTGAVVAALTPPMIYLLLNRADVRRLAEAPAPSAS